MLFIVHAINLKAQMLSFPEGINRVLENFDSKDQKPSLLLLVQTDAFKEIVDSYTSTKSWNEEVNIYVIPTDHLEGQSQIRFKNELYNIHSGKDQMLFIDLNYNLNSYMLGDLSEEDLDKFTKKGVRLINKSIIKFNRVRQKLSEDDCFLDSISYTNIGTGNTNTFISSLSKTYNLIETEDFLQVYIQRDGPEDQVPLINFDLNVCDEYVLTDFEGDETSIKVEEIYERNDLLHIRFDKLIENCNGEKISFEFIESIGSNAGLFFNIESDSIISKLVCHQRNALIPYAESDELCSFISSTLDHNFDLKIYPNPVSNQLNIESAIVFDKLSVYNTMGQLMSAISFSASMSVDDIPNGYYYLKIEKDGIVKTLSFVKSDF